jgi:hypothetical protein
MFFAFLRVKLVNHEKKGKAHILIRFNALEIKFCTRFSMLKIRKNGVFTMIYR